MVGRSRRRRILWWRLRLRRLARYRSYLALAGAWCMAMGLLASGGGGPAFAAGMAGCEARMVLPVPGSRILRGFDEPASPWLPGHRGVDVAAAEGMELVAPVDATVHFAGTVAGKQVVSLSHGDWTVTFEPASTTLQVGEHVDRAQRFAVVSSGSDHCDGECVHWGIRSAGRRYLDPESFLRASRVRLLPLVAIVPRRLA